MMKMVRRHLLGKYVILEEDLLERIAESSEKGVCIISMVCLVKGHHCYLLCVVIQMRKNPPSPLHKVKRKSGHDKFSE